MLDALCYATYCAMRNARGAIFADSLCVDYLVQVTNTQVLMTVAVAVAIEEASK